MTKHEKSKHPPLILFQLPKNARNQFVKPIVRHIILSVLYTREVSVQEALWIRPGKKLCSSSCIFITLPSLHFTIGEDSRPRRTDDAFVFSDGLVRHTSALMLFYVQRPDSLNDLSLLEYTSKYRPSKSVDPWLKLSAPDREYEYAHRRPRHAIVFIRARIDSADIESFSQARLFLHVSWRLLDAIGPRGQEPAAILITVLEGDASLSIQRIVQHYECLSTQESQMKNQQSADRERAQRLAYFPHRQFFWQR